MVMRDRRRILVTGAGGLLGSTLVPLLGESADVIAAGRAMLDLSRPIAPTALPVGTDAVVYLAQSRRFRDFPEAADDIFQVNVANAVALADQARRAGARHFVYASTGGVSAPSDAPLTEQSPLAEPMGYYPASKRAAELLLLPFAADMTVVILRFFFIYGPAQPREMLIPRLVDSVRDGRPVNLQGQDGMRLNPIHVDDAARATAAALTLSHSATINVAGPQALSLRALCETIGGGVGRPPQFAVDAVARPGHLVADTTQMDALLGAPVRKFGDHVAELLGA